MIRFLMPHRARFQQSALLALLAAGVHGALARAESPGTSVRCILLRNGNVLEGQPIEEGDSITILLGEDQSLRLPANQVLCWAEDRLQLYRYRLEHRTQSDLFTHLEAARWCIREDLLEPAAAELEAAQAIGGGDPSIVQVQTLLRTVRQQAREKPQRAEKQQARKKEATTEQPTETEQHEARNAGSDRDDPAPAEDSSVTLARLSRSTIADYASRVQPIMINRCGQAGCHGGADALQTDWRLSLPPSRQYRRLPAEMTRGNLRDLIRWIDQNRPQSSPLLKNASASHADMLDPPLGPADDEVLAELETWITSVAAELRDDEPHSEPQIAARPRGTSETPWTGGFDSVRGREQPRVTSPVTSESSPRPKRLPPVANPFDPQVFNRLHHLR